MDVLTGSLALYRDEFLCLLKRGSQIADAIRRTSEADMDSLIDEDPTGHELAKRWRNFGKDRLYVNEPCGSPIGWLDLKTGERVIKLPSHVDVFERAVAEWLAAHPDTSSALVALRECSDDQAPPVSEALSPPPARVGSPSISDEPWTDLAENLPGQAVRAQAIAQQREQPVMTWFARVLGVHTEEWAWRTGEKGEELVAKELARLPEGWHVLHSIRVGDSGADIDHLVIGRAGVFSLNTKHHRNASIWVARNVFMVNGQRQPYIRNSRHEAERVARILSRACGTRVDVRGVVVVVNTDSFTIKEPPVDVKVLSRLQLRRWLREQSWVLDEASVERIFEAARRSSTWSGKL